MQHDINQLESELVGKAAKIKTTGDIIEFGKKHGFFVMVIGRKKYGMVIEKDDVIVWVNPKD